MAETTKTFFANESGKTIFLQPTYKEEIANIVSSLNSSKACGQNSIPNRTLFLPKIKFRSNW